MIHARDGESACDRRTSIRSRGFDGTSVQGGSARRLLGLFSPPVVDGFAPRGSSDVLWDTFEISVDPSSDVDKMTRSPPTSFHHSHGYCKRSEAKSWVRHGRVTFEGEIVKKADQKVVVR